MFTRLALDYMLQWKDRAGRRPLIIRGARQVGKSVLVRMLAGAAFESLVELNFERDPEAAALFESKDPATILPLLELRSGARLVPGKTLLFLDEVQAAPQVIAALRYFFERLPQLHIVAAGSLLDFALQEPEFSVPVGRVEYLFLGPVQFEEFLAAAGQEPLLSFLRAWVPGQDLHPTIHAQAMAQFRTFTAIGGMPEAVSLYLKEQSFLEAEMLRQAILTTFREDFGKYARRASVARVRRVFDRLPLAVGRHCKYSFLDPEAKSREVSQALELLVQARVAFKIPRSSANGVPLLAQTSERGFKVLALDVGLMLTQLGLRPLPTELLADLTLANAGAIAEQVIGQHLLYSEPPYREPSLCYWARESRGSSAELDYVLEHRGRVIPVEVKAGKSGTLRSLHAFVNENGSPLALRFNADPPSLLEAPLEASDRGAGTFKLLSLPFYLAGQTRRLLDCPALQG
jgi:predicted AAA+ superfamily ATPase